MSFAGQFRAARREPSLQYTHWAGPLRLFRDCSKQARSRSSVWSIASLESIKVENSLCLRDSVSNSSFAFSRSSKSIEELATHRSLLTSRTLSNRHKHGLEIAVTPCVFNKAFDSNRHKSRASRIAQTASNNTRAPIRVDTTRRPLFQFRRVSTHTFFLRGKGGN
jgi:hypothetical protein